jgi:hypothetical protein
MSPINFEALAKQHPEYKRALLKLASWMTAHADVGVIDPKSLSRELWVVDKAKLAAALMLLVRAGHLRRVYKVVTPSGVLAAGEFDDPTKIPEKIPDRFENYFDTSEAEVVPVFKPIA